MNTFPARPPAPGRPRILLMVRALDHGGCERQLTEVALALDRERFDTRVAAFHTEGIRARELRSGGIPLVRVPVASFKSPRTAGALWDLARYVRTNRISLVHTFDVPVTASCIPAVRMLTPALALASQRSHLELISGAQRRVTVLAERMAHGVVANCEFIRSHLIRDAGIAPERIQLCHNGIDLERFRRFPEPRPPELPAGALVVGVVCVLRPEKGLLTLVDGFAEAHAAAPGMRLLFVGSGPMLPRLQERARERGIFDACVFTPSTDRVENWLRHIDVFVLPSLSEAFSNSLMEAMACGCCALASRVGGNPELIEDGVRGLLFEAGDAADLSRALRRVIADASLRKRLADAGHDFLHANFSIRRSAARMAEIYAQLLRLPAYALKAAV